jgi:hypothetical protein
MLAVELLVTANVVPSSLILSTLMMEAIYSSETLVFVIASLLHISEDDILLRGEVSEFNSGRL